eukprot:m.498702 g.498702  ORF g.498702 m.498702 type:complete len:53 (+) comp55038_c0_seq1:193-351(+)
MFVCLFYFVVVRVKVQEDCKSLSVVDGSNANVFVCCLTLASVLSLWPFVLNF